MKVNEIVMTECQKRREKQKTNIRARFKELNKRGSSVTALYEMLAEEFGVSRYTILRYVKGAPVKRKPKTTEDACR